MYSVNVNLDKLLTIPEVAALYRVSRSKLYADQRRGILRVVRLGRVIRVRQSDLDKYAGGRRRP